MGREGVDPGRAEMELARQSLRAYTRTEAVRYHQGSFRPLPDIADDRHDVGSRDDSNVTTVVGHGGCQER
eukprot:898219-Rhodomonas_salina.1